MMATSLWLNMAGPLLFTDGIHVFFKISCFNKSFLAATFQKK